MRRHRSTLLLDFLVVLRHHHRVQGSGATVPVQQHHGPFHLQNLRSLGRIVLFSHDRESHWVQGRNRRLRQLDEHLSGVRLRWWPLLRQQRVQGREHHLQEFALCGVRYARRDIVHGNPMLRG